jgi:hypothetical protein
MKCKMDKTPCPQCGRTGLVRVEVVVKGCASTLTYDCGYCEHTWQEADRRTPDRVERQKRRAPDSIQ